MSTESKWDDAKGRAKEAAGDLTDNKKLERKGQLDQAKSSAKDTIEDVKDKASDLVDKVTDKAKAKR